MKLLVAPAAFGGTLRACQVAGAIGRGLEQAGLEPPDLCPVADGGEGTIEVLLTRLGGETAAARVCGRQVGFALLDGGATALIEAAGPAGSPGGTAGAGELILAGVEAGAAVVIVGAGGAVAPDGGDGAITAIEAGGGLRGARLLVLCDVQRPADLGSAGAGLAAGLRSAFSAELRPGAQFVLEALDFDARMRAADAVVLGEARLGRASLDGRILSEVATRARQAGVPAHAIVGVDELDRFDARILDLQEILTGQTVAEIEAAARDLAERLRPLAGEENH